MEIPESQWRTLDFNDSELNDVLSSNVTEVATVKAMVEDIASPITRAKLEYMHQIIGEGLASA